MQTKARRTARKAITAGIAAAAAAGATVFTVQYASAEEQPQAAQTCVREALPIPEGLASSRVSAMSDDGSVIAYFALPLDQSWPDGLGAYPRLYADGEVTDVPMPGNHPRIRDVNSLGNGTGYSTNAQGRDVPYVWSDGVLEKLPIASTGGRAEGINEHGDIVGSVQTADGGVPLLWPADGSTRVRLPLPAGATSGYAHDIGDDGTIIGAVYNENGTATAYRWDADRTGEALPVPEGADPAEAFSIAVDINGDWASGQFFVPGAGSQPLGVRWNLAEGTAERTQLDQQVAVSADGTVAGFVAGTPDNAAYQAGDTVVELPGVIPPAERTMGETAQEISADGTLIAGDIYVGDDDAGLANFNAVVWTCQ
ncbi:hypothetical protein [Glycomyces harbinensis]|uniref:Extracellular repeat, HAF family n=1 Tax=Glycomyces harbinensis TaxID=58114 RepID=A0A1G6XXS5_9ACTN|nr:hypothetical protein [Glycomyces harbinensis]SDD82900.1 hypothetical protein SAMN05216270_10818 [Glycomyces harbinensis]